jgi:hypothetical protein
MCGGKAANQPCKKPYHLSLSRAKICGHQAGKPANHRSEPTVPTGCNTTEVTSRSKTDREVKTLADFSSGRFHYD